MKHFTVSMLVLVLMGAAITFSVTGAPGNFLTKNIEIKVQDKNPFTHLNLNNNPEEFQFAILTDRTGGRRPGIFTSAIHKLNLLQPEFVMSIGDLIQGATENRAQLALEWSEFEGKVKQLEMPFFYCAGNHDITNLPMSKEWHRKFGRSYYSFRYHDVFFLVLNTEEKPAPADSPYYISPEQQKWALEEIKNNKNVRWTFVMLHKPTWTYTNADMNELGWLPIEKGLAGQKYTVFTGHRHNYGRYIRKENEYYVLATTGGSSKLTGLKNGSFDHFVWVTMKPNGPVIANLLLDGVVTKDIRTLPDPSKDK